MSALAPYVHAGLLVCLGMTLEVVFVALTDLPQTKDLRLKGHTYVWMIPIYALLYPGFAALLPLMGHWPWAARGILYTLLIFLVEYVSGWLLRKTTGRCPWDYTGRKWAVHGLIRLDFAPAWFAASLTFEFVYRILRGA